MTKEERKALKAKTSMAELRAMVEGGMPFVKVEELTGWYPSQLSLLAKAWGLGRGPRGRKAAHE